MVLVLLWLGVVSLCAASDDYTTDQLLSKIDSLIEHKNETILRKQSEILKLQTSLGRVNSNQERFDLMGSLFRMTIHFDTEMAHTYAKQRDEIAQKLSPENVQESQLDMMELYNISGMYYESKRILDSLKAEGIAPALKIPSFHQARQLYNYLHSVAIESEEKEHYQQMADSYKDSLLLYLDKDDLSYSIVKAEDALQNGRGTESIAILNALLEEDGLDHSGAAIISHVLSRAYGSVGDVNGQKRALALSAYHDLKEGIREYISLQELAQLLYREGDIERAYRYVQCAVEDAQNVHAPLRMLETAKIFPIIESTKSDLRERNEQILRWLLISVSLIGIIAVATGTFIFLQHRRLKKAKKQLDQSSEELKRLNKKLSDSNQELSKTLHELNMSYSELNESNLLKVEYIGHYIGLCSEYIDKLDNYRKWLQKLTKKGDIGVLERELRDRQKIENELKAFYTHFDSTFLNLFPTFIEDFKALLVPEAELNIKQDELLNTELRIYALVRLGITDSQKIAHFLRYSSSTIYNYRTKMRNLARGDRDRFEEQVMEIGSSSQG